MSNQPKNYNPPIRFAVALENGSFKVYRSRERDEQNSFTLSADDFHLLTMITKIQKIMWIILQYDYDK